MIVFGWTLFLIFLVDTVLVGLAFFALKNRFNWNLSPKLSFVILFVIFGLFENYLLPMCYVLDARLTIGNEQVAEFLDFPPDYPVMDLFGLGLFQFITWSLQAFFAGLIGEKLLKKKERSAL